MKSFNSLEAPSNVVMPFSKAKSDASISTTLRPCTPSSFISTPNRFSASVTIRLYSCDETGSPWGDPISET